MKKTAYLTAISLATISCFGAVANAADDDDSLTKYGITFYGTVDVGLMYQTHGTPDGALGTHEGYISSNMNNPAYGIAGNNMQQSKIGIKGTEDLMDGLSAVFKLESGFSPTQGTLMNGPGSIIGQAGTKVPNANNTQPSANADSSRAGQLFNAEAYGGLTFRDYGTLTFGRNNTIIMDEIYKYDPMSGSYAFSPLGYSGSWAGMGNTEEARVDDSLKYKVDYAPAHLALMLKAPVTANSVQGMLAQIAVGADVGDFSIDATYGMTHNAISFSGNAAFTADQGTFTESDTTAYTLMAKYKWNDFRFFAGFEHVGFQNPAVTTNLVAISQGGYAASSINTSAYNNERILNMIWLGVNYQLTEKTKVMGAWYHYNQNSYNGNGCTDNSSGSCSGSFNEASLVFDEVMTKHLDFYEGVSYSVVANGLAAGFIANKNTNYAVGARLNF